jgi:protein TonB
MQGTTQEKNGQECTEIETVLGRCLVEGDSQATSLARLARRKTFGVSLAIELSLLGLLVVAPLFTSTAKTQLQKNQPPPFAFFDDWREHRPVRRADPSTNVRRPQPLNPDALTPPTGVTVRVRNIEESSEVPIPDLGGADGVGGGPPTGDVGAILLVEPPQIAKLLREEKRPVKISEGVLQAQLISRIEPRYPPLAKLTRTEGSVQLHAIIGRDGRITSLEVISGPPLLVQAALDAVRQWTYRPTMLNGEPAEVETSITVIFRLHE